MLFLGIDPGLNRTGIGLVSSENNVVKYVAHKLVKTDSKADLVDRLKQIVEGVTEFVEIHKPEYAAIEDIFFSTNARSALLLGQTRGAIIAALVLKNVRVKEYTALQIKKAISGYGRADKEQVRKMVELHLNLISIDKKIPLDITDALACALCLSYHATSYMISNKLI